MAQPQRDVRAEMMQEEIPATSEERRKKLSDMLETADSTAKKVKTDAVLSKQQLESAKMEMMRGFMELLQKFGVDPSDAEEITSFLEEVERTDPALYDLFEAVFSSIESVGQPIARDEVIEESVPETGPTAPGMAPGPMPKMPVKRLGRAAEMAGELPPAPPSPGGRTPSSFQNLMGGMS